MIYQYERAIEVKVAGLLIHNLRIAFDYSNTADTDDQKTSVTLYNLKEDTYKQLYSLQRTYPHNILSLKAGYLENTGLQTVFVGPIAWIDRDAKEGTITTTIHIGDRIRDDSPNWVEVSEKEISAREAITKVAAQMGMTVMNLGIIPSDMVLENINFSDHGENAMRTILSSLRQEVPYLYPYQEKNRIVLTKGADPRADLGLIVKSPKNGLIGVPRIEEDERLTVRMLLDHRIELKNSIRFVLSKYINDTVDYTVDKVRHIGDNWTGDFITELECIPPGYKQLASDGRVARTAQGQSGRDLHGGNSAPSRGSD